jgi:hypothetical protein
MSDEIHDHSRVDAFMTARRRAMLLHAVWRPMLAGAIGAALVIAAIWVTLPKFSYREIDVPRVTMRDVTVPNIVPHDVQVDHVVPKDVEIDVPRIARAPETSAVAPRTPEERRFEGSKDWQDPNVVVRGRILRQDGRGFVLATDEGETSFFLAKIGLDGRPQPNLAVRSIVAPYLGDLCFCSRLPPGTFHCVALHDGAETEIRQIPIPGPTSGKPAVAASAILIRLESVEANR